MFSATYAVRAVCAVIFRAWGIDTIYPQVVALFILTSALLVLATLLLRRTD
jgi:ABC-type multidrug transport system permease subunit